MVEKKHTSKYLTLEAIELLRLLSQKMGLSQNSVMEIAIRNLASQQGVQVPKEQAPDR